MRAIELADLGRAYGERVALAGVTLALEEGETLAVFGANGAGKTTLLRILATLLRPHRGTATVLGRELPREGWAVRGRLGFLGHEPLLYRDLTARENLQFHARLHDVRVRRGSTRCSTRSGCSARADDPVHTFSRGMVQRTAVCRAVLHEPELLLLDEPLAGLDPGAVARGRAADLRRHARGHLPRRRARARRGRPRARAARRAAGAAASARRRDRRRRPGAVRMRRAVGALIRKDVRLELRTPRVGAGDGAVLALDVRALPLRARRGRGRGLAGGRDPLGDAAVRGRARASTGCSWPSARRAASTASCWRRSTAPRCSWPRRSCCSAS